METEFHEPSLRALPPVVLTAEEAQESVEAINIITCLLYTSDAADE